MSGTDYFSGSYGDVSAFGGGGAASLGATAATGGYAMPIAMGISTLSGFMGGSSAAKRQEAASRYAADLQYKQYLQQRADAEPWRQSGISALGNLKDNMGDYTRDFTMGDFTRDPGYQFRMDEGQRGIEASAAARGMTNSGRSLKELTRYGQDYASGEYNNAYNRFNNDRTTRFNRLSSLAGMGQTANNQLSQAGSNYANQAGEYALQGGNASAAGAMQLPNALNTGINNWMKFTQMGRGE